MTKYLVIQAMFIRGSYTARIFTVDCGNSEDAIKRVKECTGSIISTSGTEIKHRATELAEITETPRNVVTLELCG